MTANEFIIILLQLEGLYRNSPVIINRSYQSIINEWAGHKLLYQLGISKNRTLDVDLPYPPDPWYYRLFYNTIGYLASLCY